MFSNYLDPCLISNCGEYAKCLVKFDRTHQCVCPSCDQVSSTSYVCSSEGRTEPSECHVRRRGCLLGKDVYPVSNDLCSKCIRVPILSINKLFDVSREFTNLFLIISHSPANLLLIFPIVHIISSIFLTAEISKKLDLVYAVDVSKATSEQGLEEIQNYIKKDVALYKLSPSDTRVSIVTFDSDSKVLLKPKDGINMENIENAILSLKRSNSKADMPKALDFINQKLRSNEWNTDNRQDVPKTVIFFTSSNTQGVNTIGLKDNSRSTKEKATVIVVGIGDGINPDELDVIATDESNVFMIDVPKDIDGLVNKLKQAIAHSTSNINFMYFKICVCSSPFVLFLRCCFMENFR